jgi:hypothetical protein
LIGQHGVAGLALKRNDDLFHTRTADVLVAPGTIGCAHPNFDALFVDELVILWAGWYERRTSLTSAIAEDVAHVASRLSTFNPYALVASEFRIVWASRRYLFHASADGAVEHESMGTRCGRHIPLSHALAILVLVSTGASRLLGLLVHAYPVHQVTSHARGIRVIIGQTFITVPVETVRTCAVTIAGEAVIPVTSFASWY